MRKFISITCLFVAQMVCQAPSANAQTAAPQVGALAMMGSQVPGSLAPLKRETAGSWYFKIPAARGSSAALRPPRVFSITAGRTIATNLKQKRMGELFLKWSPVESAKSYVVQVCRALRCEPGRDVSLKYTSGRAEGFADLATVAETKYASAAFKRGKKYHFRIVAIDAEGRRSIPSVVVTQRAL